MSSIKVAVLLVLGLLLVMTQQSMQMSLRNPIAEIETSNCKIAFLRLGLVFTSEGQENVLLGSGLYTPDNKNPHVDIAGRRFHAGTLNGSSIIYVQTGSNTVNVATAVQILLARFRIYGIIYFGNAGSLDKNTLGPGDVYVPETVAFTGVWKWNKFSNKTEGQDKLVFGEFNYPVNGENLLGSVEHQTVKLFTPGEQPKDVFWLPITPSWYKSAIANLKDLELRPCFAGICGNPKVVFGSKGSTSDFYVKNKAYGDFLRGTFDASTADTASASVALTTLSNGKLFVVLQGISNIAGVTSSTHQTSYLASYNAFLAATKFINSIPIPLIASE